MPLPVNGAAPGAQANAATAKDAASAASEALSADDIRALVAEQVRAALDPAALSKSIAGVVNAAVTNHMKRVQPPEQGQQAQQQGQQQQGQAPPDLQIVRLQEKLAKLEEETAAERKRAADIERRSHVDGARRALADKLSAKGVVGARQRAVIADLESRGLFRLEEDGTPALAVTRARVKGSKAAELVHRDLAEAVEDWVQTEEAREFLPAPSGAINGPRGNGTARMPAGERAQKFDLTSEDGAIAAAVALMGE